MKFENHYCSDIEPYCVELYKKRFPDSIQLGDIRGIKVENLPAGEWILSGGFPCQDISIAGKGAGIYGERSSLWFEYWRLIRNLRPRFAIMENVGMLVHRGLREVCGSLAEIGYNAEWQDIRAEDMGAPHRRERIWIMAYPGLQRQAEYEEQATRSLQCRKNIPNPSLQLSYGSGETRRGRGEFTDGSDVADAERDQNRGIFKPRIPSDIGASSDRRRQADWWSTEPAICGMVDGLSDKLDRYQGRLAVKSYQRVDRLRGLGNSIVPQIAEILFRQIKSFIKP